MNKNQRDKRYIDNLYNFKNKVNCLNDWTDNQLNRTLTMFKYENLPDSIPEREIELLLQTHGYCIVTKENDKLLALWGNYAPPLDEYYRPTKVLVTNPWANINKEYTIGEDCILIRNDPLDKGLLGIIWKYGVLDLESNITYKNALINIRNMFNIIASNDNEFASANRYLENLENGELGAMMSYFDSWSVNDESQKGIQIQPGASNISGYLTQLIEGKQYIKASFFNEIGLSCNGNYKRERLTSNEVNADDETLRPLIDSMLEERQKAWEKINEMYGTNVTVDFGSTWNKKYLIQEIEEIESNEEIETNNEEIETNEGENNNED